MKKFKWMMLLFGIVMSVSAFAQNGPRQPMPVADRVARTIERLKPELNLTEPQIKDLDPVYTTYYTDMDKLGEGGKQPTPEARQKLTDDRDVKLKKILNEDQFKKLKELEAQMRQQRSPKG